MQATCVLWKEFKAGYKETCFILLLSGCRAIYAVAGNRGKLTYESQVARYLRMMGLCKRNLGHFFQTFFWYEKVKLTFNIYIHCPFGTEKRLFEWGQYVIQTYYISLIFEQWKYINYFKTNVFKPLKLSYYLHFRGEETRSLKSESPPKTLTL